MNGTGDISRQSNFELLRIISMVMITFHHFAVHGGFDWTATTGTIPYLWYNFIIMGGKVGVDVFVLISGYFLISSNESSFNAQKVFKLWGQVFFYSVVIYIIGLAAGICDFGIKSFIKAIFPITFSSWWFASTYFVLFIIHPFLNKLLCSLGKKAYQSLLLVLVILWSVIPTFTTSAYQSNSLLWFVTLYAIAGYIRIYGLNKKFTTRHYFLFYFVLSILTYLSSVIFTLMGTKWPVFAAHARYFYGQEKLPVLLISVSLFMIFATLTINYYKWINILASASFGVYLIHDSNVVRPVLWLDVFRNAQYQDSLFIIPYSIMVVVIVYMVCSILDLIRQKIFEQPYMLFVNRHAEIVIKLFSKICGYFKRIVFG